MTSTSASVANSSSARAGDLLELHLPGGPGDLGAVRAVDHLLQFVGNVPDPGPDRLQLAVSALVRLLGLLPVGVGRGRRLLDPGQHDPRAVGNGAGDQGPGGPALRPRQRPRRSLSLGDGRRQSARRRGRRWPAAVPRRCAPPAWLPSRRPARRQPHRLAAGGRGSASAVPASAVLRVCCPGPSRGPPGMLPRPAALPGPAPPARPAWPAASATWARLCWRDFSAAAMAVVSRPVSSLAALARPASEPSFPDVSAAAASACWSAAAISASTCRA